MNTFTIKAQLPSLNDLIDVCRTNKYKAAQFKKDIQEVVGWAIKQAVTAGSLKPVDKKSVVYFEWHEATRRRDADNIQSSQKYILDEMRNQGIIKNDSRRYIKNTYHEIIDDTKDFVVVRIEECKCELKKQKRT